MTGVDLNRISIPEKNTPTDTHTHTHTLTVDQDQTYVEAMQCLLCSVHRVIPYGVGLNICLSIHGRVHGLSICLPDKVHVDNTGNFANKYGPLNLTTT